MADRTLCQEIGRAVIMAPVQAGVNLAVGAITTLGLAYFSGRIWAYFVPNPKDVLMNFAKGIITDPVKYQEFVNKLEKKPEELLNFFDGQGKKAWQDISNSVNAQWEEFKTDLEKQWKAYKAKGPAGVAEAIQNILTPFIQIPLTFADLVIKNLSWSLFSKWIPVTIGLPLALRYGYEWALFNLKKPKVMVEYRHVTILTPLTNLVHRTFNRLIRRQDSDPKPIFHADVARQTDSIGESIKNLKRHGGSLPNVLLYGDPGTGKTMVAKKIAKEAGMNFVMTSGEQLTANVPNHVSEFNKIINFAENQAYQTVIFIDEADSLCSHRNTLDQAHQELLTTFLSRTGAPSKKVVYILATNRLEVIDKAVTSRMDRKIYIGPPGYQERIAILKQYVNQLIHKKDRQAFFSASQIQAIAAKTSGLTGRTLQKMINAIAISKAATKDNKLTQRLVDQTIYDFVMQERQMPGTYRSWRMIEKMSDIWHFTVPHLAVLFKEFFDRMFMDAAKE